MTNRELSIVLRELACSQPTPICEQWTKEWADDTDIDTLLNKFIEGFDFCRKNDYPSLDFCRKHFNKEDLHRHHIYIDDEVDIQDAESGYWVFLGKCNATIRVSGLKAVTVYCRHDSRVDVHSCDGSRVFVFYYNNSKGDCFNDKYSVIKKHHK